MKFMTGDAVRDAFRPIVSVIIPCHNQGRFVGCTIDSVIAQTVQDWEAIIVDDGSTDDSAAVVSAYDDPRIRYIYQENLGASAARNTGILASRGKYLAFLDADDEWRPEFLERCLQVLEKNTSVAGVYARTQYMDESGALLPVIAGGPQNPEALRRSIWEGGQFPIHSALVRRDVVHEIGLFDEGLKTVNDWDFWIRVVRDHDLYAIPEVLAHYRVTANSLTTMTVHKLSNRMTVLRKHLGPLEGESGSCPTEKRRAYSFAFRATGLEHIQAGESEQGWQLIRQAVIVWPELLGDLTTFYELACGDQPRGYRGQAGLLDIATNGREMLRWLDDLFADASLSSQKLRQLAYGNAYLALAMLSDQAGEWPQARRYLLNAIRVYPRMMADVLVLRRLVKLSAGKRVIGWLRRLLPTPVDQLSKASS